ncbi:MAG: hypothetical protein Q9181_007936 [Wetmoreana brouardii]
MGRGAYDTKPPPWFSKLKRMFAAARPKPGTQSEGTLEAKVDAEQKRRNVWHYTNGFKGEKTSQQEREAEKARKMQFQNEKGYRGFRFDVLIRSKVHKGCRGLIDGLHEPLKNAYKLRRPFKWTEQVNQSCRQDQSFEQRYIKSIQPLVSSPRYLIAVLSCVNADELQKKFNDNYRIQDHEKGDLNDDIADDIEDAMKDLGIVGMGKVEYHETEVFSKAGPEAGAGQDAVAWAEYMPDKGIIIGEARFSERDLNPDNLKLRPSDLTFLQWKDAAGDAQVKGLRAFVGRHILSKSTVTAMQQAQRDTRQPLYEKATFERGANTPEKQRAFHLMMGTDFISSLGYMLKDNAPPLKFFGRFPSSDLDYGDPVM